MITLFLQHFFEREVCVWIALSLVVSQLWLKGLLVNLGSLYRLHSRTRHLLEAAALQKLSGRG